MAERLTDERIKEIRSTVKSDTDLAALCDQALSSRSAALEEAARVADAEGGRHFAAIGNCDNEADKRKHGIKTAFAMEFAAALRALAQGEQNDKEKSWDAAIDAAIKDQDHE